MTFSEVHEAHSWRPIPGCPGRYVLTGGPSSLPPETVAGSAVPAVERDSEKAADPVSFCRLEGGGGLISFWKPDGRFIHTLCTEDGYLRKLTMLGLEDPTA